MPYTTMPHVVTWTDRLRIERLVQALSQRLYDLPHRRRIACIREVRQNILAAAQETGTAEALRRLGGADELAREYLDAEYGHRLRPSWITASIVCILIPSLFQFFLTEAAMGNQAAITAVDPHATGTFTVTGIEFLQHATVYTLSNGHASLVGGDWTPLFYVLWIAVTIASGRLWRIRARGRAAASPSHSRA
jgi:hypothetical protein